MFINGLPVLCTSSSLAKGSSTNNFGFNSHYDEKLSLCINVSLALYIDMIYSFVVHLNGAAMYWDIYLLLVIINGDRFVNFRLLTPHSHFWG